MIEDNEKLQLKETLHEFRTLMNAIFAKTSDYFFTTDIELIITQCNKSLNDLTAKETIGLPSRRFFPEGQAKDIIEAVKQAGDTGAKYTNIVDMLTSSGTKHFEVKVTPIVDEGVIIGTITILNDLTDIQNLEKQGELLRKTINSSIDNPDDSFKGLPTKEEIKEKMEDLKKKVIFLRKKNKEETERNEKLKKDSSANDVFEKSDVVPTPESHKNSKDEDPDDSDNNKRDVKIKNEDTTGGSFHGKIPQAGESTDESTIKKKIIQSVVEGLDKHIDENIDLKQQGDILDRIKIALNHENTHLSKRIKDTEPHIEKFSQENDALKQKIVVKSDLFVDLKKDNANLKGLLAEVEGNLSNLLEENGKVSQDLKRLKEQYGQLKTENVNLQGQIAEDKSQIDQKESENKQYNEDLDRQKHRYDQLQKENTTLKGDLAEEQTKLSQIANENTDHKKELEKALIDQKELETENLRLKQESTASKELNRDLTSENIQLRDQIADDQDKLKKISNENQSLRDHLVSQISEFQSAIREKTELANHVREMEKEFEKQTFDLEKLREQKERMRSYIEKIKSHSKKAANELMSMRVGEKKGLHEDMIALQEFHKVVQERLRDVKKELDLLQTTPSSASGDDGSDDDFDPPKNDPWDFEEKPKAEIMDVVEDYDERILDEWESEKTKPLESDKTKSLESDKNGEKSESGKEYIKSTPLKPVNYEGMGRAFDEIDHDVIGDTPVQPEPEEEVVIFKQEEEPEDFGFGPEIPEPKQENDVVDLKKALEQERKMNTPMPFTEDETKAFEDFTIKTEGYNQKKTITSDDTAKDEGGQDEGDTPPTGPSEGPDPQKDPKIKKGDDKKKDWRSWIISQTRK